MTKYLHFDNMSSSLHSPEENLPNEISKSFESLPFETQLLDLNDDCLLLILEHIAFEELILLHGKICQRLDALIDIRLKRFTNYTIMMRQPPQQFNDMQLQKIGNNLHKLYISVGYSIPSRDVITIVRPILIGAAYTRSLTIFTIHYVYWLQEYLDVLDIIMPQLVQLDISKCEILGETKLGQTLCKGICLRRLIMRGVSPIPRDCLNDTVIARLDYLEVDAIGTEFNDFDIANIHEMYPNLYIISHDIMTGNTLSYGSKEKSLTMQGTLLPKNILL